MEKELSEPRKKVCFQKALQRLVCCFPPSLPGRVRGGKEWKTSMETKKKR